MGELITVEEFMRGKSPHTPSPFTQEELDAAKRAADIINEARQSLDWDSLRQCWIAIRLSDGDATKSNGRYVIYDTKRDAVRDQLHEQQCAYIAFRNLINGATQREMLRVLRYHRMIYKAGFRLPDPDAIDGGPDVAPTSGLMDALSGRRRLHK